MGMNKPQIHDLVENARTMLLWDDFEWYTTGQLWSSTTTGGSASVAVASPNTGGQLVLTTGATQNNEAAVVSSNALALFQSGHPLIFQCEINYTEAATNQAGIVCGVASSWTHILADTTFALPASFSGALVYKAPGSTVWSLHTQVGTTLLDQQSGTSTLQPGLNQRIVIYMMMDQAGSVEVSAEVGTPGIQGLTGTVSAATIGQSPNGLQWLLPNFAAVPYARATPIKQYVPYASAAALQAGVFLKSGSASSVSEICNVDYIGMEYLARP